LAAAAFADDHIGPVPVVLGLGDAHGLLQVLVREGWVEDFVAVRGEKSQLHAALKAVQATLATRRSLPRRNSPE
jgi:hypothetical protein